MKEKKPRKVKADKPAKAAKETTKAVRKAGAVPATTVRQRPARPVPGANRPGPRRSEWVPAENHPQPISRALRAAIKAFKGDKSALAEWLGMHKPNLSRALRESKKVEEGGGGKVGWPAKSMLKLAKVSGMTPHELGPDIYEPSMKTERYKPQFDAEGQVVRDATWSA